MLSLPVLFRRDLDQLLALSAEQLIDAARAGMPVYGFVILRARWSPGGSLRSLVITRSGVTLLVDRLGRIVPAERRRKVG
jgi:hypothetical protein